MEPGITIRNITANFFNVTTIASPVQETILLNLALKIVWYLVVVVNPVIAVFGLVGNFLSGVVLVKSGIKKPSNILLLALCIADSISLLAAINIPRILQYFHVKVPINIPVWEYPEDISFILFVMTLFFQACTFYGIPLSASLCSFIAMERFVAVFYPLQFNAIVTTRRIWFIVGVAFAVWIPYGVAYTTVYQFQYIYYPAWNVHFGLVTLTKNSDLVFFQENIFRPFSHFVPLIIVTVGSVLISVRVTMTMRKRQKIISSSTKTITSSSRTTKTLLAVCFVFSVTKITALVGIIFKDNTFTDPPTQILLVEGTILLNNINNACNFLIYVTLNKQFAKVFTNMLRKTKT